MPSRDMSNYAPKAWADRDFDFQLPSGDVCLLRRMEPTDLIELGLQDKLDFATNVVLGEHAKNAGMSKVEKVKADRARREAKAKGEDPEAAVEALRRAQALNTLTENPEQVVQFRDVLNAVIVHFVVAPEMHHPPEKDKDRVDGRFYVDAVPFNDKVAIFNKLMDGVRKIEQFREGSEEAVGAVAPQPGVRKPAQRRAPARRKGSAS